MLSLAIFAFGMIIFITKRCPISKTLGLKDTGARLAGVAVMAWAFGAYDVVAAPLSRLCGGLDTTAGVLTLFGARMTITGLIIFGLIKYFGNAYAADNPRQ